MEDNNNNMKTVQRLQAAGKLLFDLNNLLHNDYKEYFMRCGFDDKIVAAERNHAGKEIAELLLAIARRKGIAGLQHFFSLLEEKDEMMSIDLIEDSEVCDLFVLGEGNATKSKVATADPTHDSGAVEEKIGELSQTINSINATGEEVYFFLCSKALLMEDFDLLIEKVKTHESTVSSAPMIHDNKERMIFKKLTGTYDNLRSSLIFVKIKEGDPLLALNQFRKRVSQLSHIILIHVSDKQIESIDIPRTLLNKGKRLDFFPLDADVHSAWEESLEKEECQCQAKNLQHNIVKLTAEIESSDMDKDMVIGTNHIQKRLAILLHRNVCQPLNDELPCFLKYWTALDHQGLDYSSKAIGLLKFSENLQTVLSKWKMLTCPLLQRIKALFFTTGSTVLVFATSWFTYWELWFQTEQLKQKCKDDGLTLTELSLLSQQETAALISNATDDDVKLQLNYISGLLSSSFQLYPTNTLSYHSQTSELQQVANDNNLTDCLLVEPTVLAWLGGDTRAVPTQTHVERRAVYNTLVNSRKAFSVCRITTNGSQGTGFHLGNGWVATNSHILRSRHGVDSATFEFPSADGEVNTFTAHQRLGFHHQINFQNEDAGLAMVKLGIQCNSFNFYKNTLQQWETDEQNLVRGIPSIAQPFNEKGWEIDEAGQAQIVVRHVPKFPLLGTHANTIHFGQHIINNDARQAKQYALTCNVITDILPNSTFGIFKHTGVTGNGSSGSPVFDDEGNPIGISFAYGRESIHESFALCWGTVQNLQTLGLLINNNYEAETMLAYLKHAPAGAIKARKAIQQRFDSSLDVFL